MSNVQCKAFDYVEIYIYPKMVNIKTFLLAQMPKLGMGPMSNAQFWLPDDDNRTW